MTFRHLGTASTCWHCHFDRIQDFQPLYPFGWGSPFAVCLVAEISKLMDAAHEDTQRRDSVDPRMRRECVAAQPCVQIGKAITGRGLHVAHLVPAESGEAQTRAIEGCLQHHGRRSTGGCVPCDCVHTWITSTRIQKLGCQPPIAISEAISILILPVAMWLTS